MRFSGSSTSWDLSHRAIAQACAIGVGNGIAVCAEDAQQGLGCGCRWSWTTRRSSPLLFLRAAPVQDRVRATSKSPAPPTVAGQWGHGVEAVVHRLEYLGVGLEGQLAALVAFHSNR